MKLRDQMLQKIRMQGKSQATFKSYWGWCERYLRFCRSHYGDWKHPSELGEADVERWLSMLANNLDCAPNTQNVALQSVCYLYKQVLGRPLSNVNAIRAKGPQRVREVLDASEVSRLFDQLDGIYLLTAQLIYGCGLRISDVAQLRIKDISFERCQLHIRDGKGCKDRYCSFPVELHDLVKNQIESMRKLHAKDLRNGANGVSLPCAFGRKSPRSRMDFSWWYLFTAPRYSLCPVTKQSYRHHRHRTHLGAAISKAAVAAGIEKRVTSHVLRHCYATHANELGVNVTSLQKLLGHSDIRTTMVYVHANQHGVTSSQSPLADLLARRISVNPRLRATG